MASTIKLKNGTSGAPSSLAGGEVAMNRTTGIFYFGNGSNVQELHRFNNISASGHITASGHISASGDVTAVTGSFNNLTIGGAQGSDGQVLTSTGTGVAWEDAAGGSVSGNTFATDLKVGRDADNLIDFTTDNQVTFRVSAGNGVVMKASGEIEATKFDGALEGNADTATALATARNIGGVSFDGTGDIDLPGVNGAGDQNTSGNAATATKLAATKTIAGVAFDGSTNISLNNDSITNGAGYTTNTGTVDTSGSPVDDDFAKFTDANTIEGRSIAEVKTDLSLNNVENKSSATIRGEIASGDIPNNASDTTGTATNATTAAVATTVTITDNEDTNEDNAIIFTSGGDVDGGNIGLESDGDLTYNPSTGKLTATQLASGFISGSHISSSGTVGALKYQGTPMVLAHASQYIGTTVANNYYYGNDTQGFFHHQHNAKETSMETGHTLGQGAQHNAILIPCNVKDIELRAACRTNYDADGGADGSFAFWIMKSARASQGSSNPSLTFLASASAEQTPADNQHNRMHTADITGAHTFRTNMTASADEQLFVFFQPYYGAAANTKYYWTLSARTNE